MDEQVVYVLSHLNIPEGYRQRVEEAVRTRVENAAALERMQELQAIVERIDFSWENGFLKPEEYLDKRTQLQKEMESLRPFDYDNLMEAADLLEHFGMYWDECAALDDPDAARQQLVGKIVDKVFVYDKMVIAIALHGDYGVILDNGEAAPMQIVGEISKTINKTGAADGSSGCTQIGSDGVRTRDLRLDRPTC